MERQVGSGGRRPPSTGLDDSSAIEDVTVSRPRGGVAVVELQGEHDSCTDIEFGRLLEELTGRNRLVVIDVSGAKFIDSSVLHNLVKADSNARDAGKRLVLQMGTAAIVRQALEVSGLLEHLDCARSREEALLQPDS